MTKTYRQLLDVFIEAAEECRERVTNEQVSANFDEARRWLIKRLDEIDAVAECEAPFAVADRLRRLADQIEAGSLQVILAADTKGPDLFYKGESRTVSVSLKPPGPLVLRNGDKIQWYPPDMKLKADRGDGG